MLRIMCGNDKAGIFQFCLHTADMSGAYPNSVFLLLLCSECLQLPAILYRNPWPDLQRDVIINSAFTMCQALSLSVASFEPSSKSRMGPSAIRKMNKFSGQP